MSERSVSPYWWLLLLVLCLPIGWLVGRLEGGSPHAGEAALTALPAASAGTVEPTRWTTLDQALAQSRRSGKPVMLDFNAEWCGPCQALKRDVFDDGDRGEQVKRLVVPVSVTDRSREEGRNPQWIEDLQRKYQIDAFPTLIVFSPATGRTEHTVGYGGGDASLDWIKSAAQSVR